ncbi:MAG: esterase family protein [Deltaproteobacteria bacterium]|nr:esterase family protein [Deltaproteobacteria bacterium]
MPILAIALLATVTAHTLHDPHAARDRRLWVYTPPGYSTSSTPFDLLIAFDGEEYQDDIPLPAMLDELAASHRAPPMVAVLVDNGSGAARTADLGNSAKFNAFLADTLIPWVRKGWNVTRDPAHTIVTGSSAGGLGAASAAFAHPDVFGVVLSQSGAFWRGNEGSNDAPYEWLTEQVAASPKKPVRFWLEVGERETHAVLGGSGPVFIEANRRFAEALKAKGYDVTLTIVPDGVHSPETWKARLPAALEAVARKVTRP